MTKLMLPLYGKLAAFSLRKIAMELDLERMVGKGSPSKAKKGDVIPRGEDAEGLQNRHKFLDDSGLECPAVRKDAYPIEAVKGNVENYIGVAKVPIGLAGPLLVHGEHAEGEFFVPMATTEGALVASYNRGMKIIRECGGCKVRIFEDGMQRAPMFAFATLEESSKFSKWIAEHKAELDNAASITSGRVSLKTIDVYNLGRSVYLRFTFGTGDAAGQNMCSKASFAICKYIEKMYPGKIDRYWLEANFATDKKHSHVNVLRARGKKVTAEIEIPRKILEEELRTTPERLATLASDGMLGSFYSGANSNGLHAANALAAIFIACGQDAANVAESSTSIIDFRTTKEGIYIGITLPSLIVGTVGGGTGLPTQKECLTMLGCKGTGGARKFAEIVAGTVLAGEISLACAVATEEWAEAHEKMGRKRE